MQYLIAIYYHLSDTWIR